jgi:predicted ATPase
MIEQVQFRNFKALRDVTLDLDRFTVLVGPNNSGKTSILEGIHLFSEPSSILAPIKTSDTPRKRIDETVSRLSDSGMQITWRMQAKHFRLNVLRSTAKNDWEVIWGEAEDRNTKQLWNESASFPMPPLIHSVFLRLDSENIATPSDPKHALQPLSRDGIGFPSVLANLALSHPENFAQFQENVRGIMPQLRRIRFERVAKEYVETEMLQIGDERFPRQMKRVVLADSLLFDLAGAERISAEFASEGTLLVVGLLTPMFAVPGLQLLLIDDLDRGLHPTAQRTLVQYLKKLLEAFPQLQIIATTHSPFLVDALTHSQVRLTALKEDGSVTCGTLFDHPDFERWKDMMTPGEVWSLFGEKWLAGKV